MYFVRLLHHLMPELLVEFRPLSRPRRLAAGGALASGFTRRGDRGAARFPGRPVPALSLPHHPELLEGVSERPQPGQGHRRDQEEDGRAADLEPRQAISTSWPALRRPCSFALMHKTKEMHP